MRTSAVLKYEWIHFVRSPFKVVAVILFVLAAIYGLNNASDLYHTQSSEIESIETKAKESQNETIDYYDNNQKGPEGRPWVNVTEPFWAMWMTDTYHFKPPSPLIVFGVGQAEQFGYYKRVTFFSSPYDADMAEEIANPERLQTGYLDFVFSVIYLLPLLLMICLYNVKGTEVDTGIYPLISIQAIKTKQWLWTRIGFYLVLVTVVLISLLIYGGVLTNVFENNSSSFFTIFGWTLLYLIIWTLIFGLILQYGSFSIGNTLKMVGVWILFTFIIPGTVHQWISTEYPANLMTDFVDAQRDERSALQALPDSIVQQKLNELYPSILNSPAMKDSLKRQPALMDSYTVFYNQLNKKGIEPIEASFRQKNNAITRLHWINPVSYFQNKFNHLTKTHFDDYQNYRNEIQGMIDKQINVLVEDTWNNKIIDKKAYLNYINILNDN